MNNYLIIDLEATCCNDGSFPRHEMEIIEIGAVMVCSGTHQNVDEFQTFVRPIRHPTLTIFCKELTSITQQQVESAVAFVDAFSALTTWADGFAPYTFCSWGDYDRRQFQSDCKFSGIPYTLGDHINLKQQFTVATGASRRMGLAKALQKAGLSFDGTHHRGIDDARNIARLVPLIFAGSLSAKIQVGPGQRS